MSMILIFVFENTQEKALKPSTSATLTKAVKYMLNRKEFLFTYLEDGRCLLSNNENSIRPVTVGRKNRLLSDSQDGAEANMLSYSMIEMAKTNNLKLYDYKLYFLSERPSRDMSDEELEQLSPWSEGIEDRIQAFISSLESQQSCMATGAFIIVVYPEIKRLQ